MSNPDYDSENPDTESMFDFLAGEGEGARAQKKENRAAAKRELPIIRKPVPISKSGPLLPPKPGAPVQPPPQLTTGQSDASDDDLSFLADVEVGHSAIARESADSVVSPRGNVMPLRQSTEPERNKNDASEQDFDSLGLELDDGISFDNDWRAGHDSQHNGHEADAKRGGYRWLMSLAAILVVGAGVASFIFSDQLGWSNPLRGQQDNQSAALPSASTDQLADTSAIPIAPIESQSSPLMTRFRAELTQLEALVSSGSLDEADQQLALMDRTVYGYGAREFGEIELRIAGLRSGELDNDSIANNAARSAEEAAAAEAARVEQARLESEAAAAEVARVEQARLESEAAAAEAARVEQARLESEAAAAEVARVEQARLAAEAAAAEVARVEQARLAAEAAAAEVARVEQARLAAEAAAAEAARVATLAAQAEQASADIARQEQARAAQLEASRNAADRRATDRRIAEERAAIQRQEARDLRLQQARDREAALARIEAERLVAEQRAAEQLAVQNERATQSAIRAPADTTVATATIPISDDDLQLVYRRFANLQKAVRDRDINAVLSLTQRSGIRVQQIMQMFENSVDIDARIRNVSTSNATGEINGTLQIKKIQRADGSVTEPPANLASIRLSSKREPAGWSAISW